MTRKVQAALLVAGGLMMFGCGVAVARATKGVKADVPLDQVPPNVVAAARTAVPDLTLEEAKRREKRTGVVYKLEGTAGGQEYELKVTSAGEVLEVELDDDDDVRLDLRAPTPAGGAPAASVPTVQSPFREVGRIEHHAIAESSGIVASRRHAGVFWTHNDKNNAPVLYAIGREGKLIAEFPVDAVNDDWEDVAIDDAGGLYIGKIGNNKARKETIEVLRVTEPDPRAPRTSGAPLLKVERTWSLRFPAAPSDCEALFVHGGHGYVISKHRDQSPAKLFRFPLDAGATELTLEQVGDLPTDTPVTAADLSVDGARLAVLSYGRLYLFDVNGDPARAAAMRPITYATPAGKLEGACFAAGGILVTAEERQVYLMPLAAAPSSPAAPAVERAE